MKPKILAFCICVFALVISSGQVRAQCVTFSPDFAVYTSASTDGVNIYTSVTIDGSGSMYINTSIPGCSSLLNVHAIHTPFAVNVIAATDGSTSVGGGLYGTGECPNCYLSVTNNQSITPAAGMTYNFNAAVEVFCNVGGAVFGYNWPNITVRLATTSWGPPPIVNSDDSCSWHILACAYGTPTCKDIKGINFSPGCPSYMRSVTLVVNGQCEPEITVGYSATGPGPCN